MLDALRLSQIADTLNGQIHGLDASFGAVSTDSRTLCAGSLFVALRGERFDGHAYLAQVAAQGAAAALVDTIDSQVNLPQLHVADTRIALGLLGQINRRQFSGPVLAVTGSSGKTTVKEMLAAILSQHGAVLATRGNLNNDLGAPLTLLSIAPEHKHAVIELGANHVGEIAYTVALAEPHISIITNAGTAHVGEFGGPEKIVQAKGEIIDGLAATGVAVLNADDAAYAQWVARAAGRKVLSFSMNGKPADFTAQGLSQDARGCPQFELVCAAGRQAIQLQLLGLHNVANALAAAAACSELGFSLAEIASGLASLAPVRGRGVITLGHGDVRLIDDTYNANPVAVKAAIDTLRQFSGRKVLVLGDMGELGQWAQASHHEVGAYAKGKVDALYAVGPMMAYAVKAFGQHGRHFADQAALIKALAEETNKETTILLKGSRSAAMDKVVLALGGAGEAH
ncbi:UDP-N-acetylmuramoyl-tripeptide--D-alanyl-D-alanine ligase [Atopomonas sediminilitoris]|uniref:UDP-N-acetylmuramoyl-tripeptide--D-alanyl-D- alanine ligase n=1 Tax=Atopomonas sediminilitoris TaxID=2919919 RepID=UPI001F4E1014|nr:UDP-N-acetylmuramoyl-tripeptide--D-alanyl-D-alanine ligase [Atopomonas sediminilitoris]MCJ8170691.1 UDP-N-acetylmuramoyl-tripeptide--D-alanyl-D-alanine ligase [Atopomonas sediminilitoris]